MTVNNGNNGNNGNPDYRLRNHIPLSGPATREPCDGSESPMRVSLGFTPNWYHVRLGIDFGESWHLDPEYRYNQSLRMRELLSELFPTVEYFRIRWRDARTTGSTAIGQAAVGSTAIGKAAVGSTAIGKAAVGASGTVASSNGRFCPECATISSVFGIMLLSSCYGIPLEYRPDNWPDAAAGIHLPKDELASIVARGPFDMAHPASLPGGGVTVRSLFSQMDHIQRHWGPIHGYLNYQGILNVALKLRGNDLFMDMFDDPDFVHALLGHVARTIGDLSKVVQARQRASGFDIDLLSMSNCVMSMVSPEQYEKFVLPLDRQLSSQYHRFGVHTCSWVIDQYAAALRRIDRMGYIDTGMDSDLGRVKQLFPDTRRAVLYSPVRAEAKNLAGIATDLERVAREYAPCDIVLADVEATMPDQRIKDFLAMAREFENLVVP
jgi:hypothetical protein